tara:strand:- start:104 stop:280 length:177 start_codon:yes stop_codon:yes gene_type:complete
LAADHDDVDDAEKPVVCDAFEDVEFVIQATIAVLLISTSSSRTPGRVCSWEGFSEGEV